MQHEDFEDHKLHYVQRWVRVNREGSDAHVFEGSDEKEEGGDVAVESDARETPFHASTRGDTNDLLADGCQE